MCVDLARVVTGGLSNKIQIRWGNFFKTDLSKADVVYIYATSTEVAKITPYLEKQMKPGFARIFEFSRIC